ncbi:MAG: hypothetical protein ACI4UN_06380 [Muribaculaceae bacterium]
MPKRFLTLVTALGFWGCFMLITPITTAACPFSPADENSTNLCEISTDNEPIATNLPGILNSTGNPIGQIPTTKFNPSLIYSAKAISACKRLSIALNKPHTPLITESPKNGTHLQGRFNSIDYYIYTLRRIII